MMKEYYFPYFVEGTDRSSLKNVTENYQQVSSRFRFNFPLPSKNVGYAFAQQHTPHFRITPIGLRTRRASSIRHDS